MKKYEEIAAFLANPSIKAFRLARRTMEKPSIPKGTRDFGPATMGKRQFIFNTIRSVYQKYGFQPLETPSMENLSVLTGKYGDEGDQLLFKVLDSGEYFEKLITNKDLAESRHQFMNGLQLILKSLCGIVINSLDDQEIKNFAKIQEIIESDELEKAFVGIPLTPKERDLLKNFLRTESVTTSINLVYFFITSNIYKETFREKIDNQFQKFTTLVIVRGYGKILDNFLLANLKSKEATRIISEKGLRYDLTVPFARYVVMNRHEIAFPFKRYQMQPVWRADRPQKGRYREFYQCDADVVGTTSLLCEAEIVMMICEVMKGLGIADFTIKINHRGVLKGIADSIKSEGKETALYVAIDKLDKIGQDGVSKELTEAGFTNENIDLLFKLLSTKGSNEEKRLTLASLFNSDSGQKGLSDLKEVFDLLKEAGSDQSYLEFDIALARGLSYYTGCIFEVKINNVAIGSVSGGGRYDNLTQSFGDKENLSGVGISFGVDRIYDVMEELQLFPKETQRSSTVLICHFDKESMRYGLKLLTQLRATGIAAELYPDEAKIKKQLDYANKKMIPYVMVIGEEERNSGLLAFKNMEAGTQEKLAIEQIIGLLTK